MTGKLPEGKNKVLRAYLYPQTRG